MSFIEGKNYYEILGVGRDATAEEIKIAYKEIARVYHPDSNFYSELVDQELSNQHLDIFKEITAAYNTLTSKTKRVEYDKMLAPELRGWTEPQEDEDQELLETLEKMGVDPESVGITAKPKRKRKNSEAFGVFGTQILENSSESTLGANLPAQFKSGAFRHSEDAFPKSRRATFTNLIRPQAVEEPAPSMNKKTVVAEAPQHVVDDKLRALLLVFVATGGICFAMSVAAFFMLR
jgi:DnaJ-class molecular chaperone